MDEVDKKKDGRASSPFFSPLSLSPTPACIATPRRSLSRRKTDNGTAREYKGHSPAKGARVEEKTHTGRMMRD